MQPPPRATSPAQFGSNRGLSSFKPTDSRNLRTDNREARRGAYRMSRNRIRNRATGHVLSLCIQNARPTRASENTWLLEQPYLDQADGSSYDKALRLFETCILLLTRVFLEASDPLPSLWGHTSQELVAVSLPSVHCKEISIAWATWDTLQLARKGFRYHRIRWVVGHDTGHIFFMLAASSHRMLMKEALSCLRCLNCFRTR